MNCLLFNNTSCSLKQTSTIVLFYKRLKGLSFERVFRRTWTDTEELLKEKSFFILSFVFLSEFVIRQVQTNIC